MYKNKIQKAVVCALLSVLLCACSTNDSTSYCPTWKGFTFTTGNFPTYVPGNPRNALLNPGDSIHVTAHQDKLGHLINATYYTWTICDEKGNKLSDTEEYYKRTNYDGYIDGANDPIGHLRLPDPMESGRYCIKFVARYTYSAQGVIVENGSIVNNTNYGGIITPQSGSTGGGATGYLYFNVSN